MGSNKPKIKIPETFSHVLLKLHPEIKNIQIEDYQITDILEVTSYNRLQEATILVSITIKQGCSPQGGLNVYSENINKSFHYTFPDYTFVKFRCIGIHQDKLSNLELFYQLFIDV